MTEHLVNIAVEIHGDFWQRVEEDRLSIQDTGEDFWQLLILGVMIQEFEPGEIEKDEIPDILEISHRILVA